MPTDETIVARLRKLCLALPETSETLAWGHPNWKCGTKTFAVYEHYRGRRSICFKTSLLEQQALIQEQRFYVTPYVGKHGWVSLDVDTQHLDWKEVAHFILQSYRAIASPRMLQALGDASAARMVRKRAAGPPRQQRAKAATRRTKSTRSR